MTNFIMQVMMAVNLVPEGSVVSYGDVAAAVGRPRAHRAVGNALHQNPLPVETPCHRVVHANGKLAPAYAFGGIGAQRNLLIKEGVMVVNSAVNMGEYRCRDLPARYARAYPQG
jgi:methylated-DNA-protein-cysteine methyltransferase-like protein